MDSLIFSLNAVLPLIAIVALGYFLRRIKMIDDHFMKIANDFNFKITLAFTMFNNIYKAELADVLNIKLIGFALAGIFATLLLGFLFVPAIVPDNKKRGVVIQGMYRSNILLLGLPLATSLFGANNLAPMALLISVCVPLYNVIAVVVLTFYLPDQNGNKQKLNAKSIIISILKNPLIIAGALGFVFLLTGIDLPKIADTFVSDVAKIATPFSLIILGGQFKFRSLAGNFKEIIITTAFKTIISPAIMMYLGYKLLGITGAELGAIMCVFGAPAAVSSYTMAESMGSDGELAGQIVVLTTLVSAFTIFGFVWFLKSMALI